MGLTALASAPDDFAARYSSLGELILTNLPSAPFPHPKRSEGHVYHEEKYSALEHYQDNTVAIFVPKEIQATNTLDFIFHFHGWRNSVTNALVKYQLIEQLVESGRKAVLVVPQGPLNAPDSFGGKLEDPGGFDRFVADIVSSVQRVERFANAKPGKIILSGHSGGYEVMSSILANNTNGVREVWLFDGLYAQTDKFLAWSQHQPQCRFIDLYTENGGTKKLTEDLINRLRTNHVSFVVDKDNSVSSDELRTNRYVFLFSAFPHDAVLNQQRAFRTFIRTSSLEPIQPHRLFVAPPNRQVPGSRLSLDYGSLYVPPFFKAGTNAADVMVFFHGSAWCAEQNFYDAGKNAVLVTINDTNAATRFADAQQFDALINNVSAVLSSNNLCTNGVGSVWLSSFSGGYVAIRAILKHTNLFERVNGVMLADSLYAPRSSSKTNMLEPSAMEPFLNYARRATEGKCEFWFTHLFPPEEKYRDNTTTLAANYLIEKLQAGRLPAKSRNSQGAFALYRSDKGSFHVIGYEGMDTQDHFDHFYALSDLLKATALPSAAP